MAHLITPEGKRLNLNREDITVGADDSNSIRIRHKSVSPIHARLKKSQWGWVVQDMGSSHGTFVDDTRIECEWTVYDGQSIRFGQVEVRFEQATEEITRETISQSAPGADSDTRRAKVSQIILAIWNSRFCTQLRNNLAATAASLNPILTEIFKRERFNSLGQWLRNALITPFIARGEWVDSLSDGKVFKAFYAFMLRLSAFLALSVWIAGSMYLGIIAILVAYNAFPENKETVESIQIALSVIAFVCINSPFVGVIVCLLFLKANRIKNDSLHSFQLLTYFLPHSVFGVNSTLSHQHGLGFKFLPIL